MTDKTSRITAAELVHFRDVVLRLTQAQMAHRLGMERATYKNYEYPPEKILSERLSERLLEMGIHGPPINFRSPSLVRENSPIYRSPQPGFPPPAPFADGHSHPVVGRRMFPVFGLVGAAEFPSFEGDVDREDWEEFTDKMYTESPQRFFIRVRGDSMEDTWQHGDVALVHPDPNWIISGTYVCAKNAEGALLKVLIVEKGRHYLVPENPDYEIITIDEEGWSMLGYIVGLKREINARSGVEHYSADGLRPTRKVLGEILARVRSQKP